MPPLADAESAQRFHQMLMLHVARLKHRGDPVGVHQFLLGQALSLHLPAREGAAQCADCGQRFPCRTTLLTALLTRLPVPWTPVSLGRALSAARLWPSQSADHDVIQDSRLEYGDRLQVDPWYRAERNSGTGRWLFRTYERGSLQQSQHLDDDARLCDFLVTQVVRLAFPLAGRPTNPGVSSWTGALFPRGSGGRHMETCPTWSPTARRAPGNQTRRPDGRKGEAKRQAHPRRP